jgi:serine/threonine protein phosphatase PrpC
MRAMGSKDLGDTAEFTLPRAASRPSPDVASTQVAVDIGALSHQGKVRPRNEDHYLVARFGRSLEPVLTNIPEDQVPPAHADVGYGMVLADGLGGMAGGEIASSSAIQDLVNLILSTPDWIIRGQTPWIEQVMDRMRERFREIDRLLNQRALAEPGLAGMGTTMTLACSLGLDLVLCHIGDSRAYLFREDRLSQLTRDMTMAQELIDANKLSPALAATSRFRNVLTQCLGGPGMPKSEARSLRLQDDDRLLLSSDGLYDLVGDDAIAAVLRTSATCQDACQVLVDRALDAGGRDNITVIVAHYRHTRVASLADFRDEGRMATAEKK